MKKVIVILCSFILFTCTKEQITSRSYARVETQLVSSVTNHGAIFQGEITFAPGSVPDHGFLWSMNESPIFSNSDSISLGTTPGKGSFSTTLTRSLLQGQKYYVRAYAKTVDYLVYGNIVSFVSLGSDVPFSITSVFPTQHLMPRDTVTVTGKNFGSNIAVKLGDKILKPASIFSVTKTSFRFQLPDTLEKSNSFSIIRFDQAVQATQVLTAILSLKAKGNWDVRASANCVAGNKNYFGFGFWPTLSNSLFSFDPGSNSVVSTNQTAISSRAYPIAFSINGIAYFGGGNSGEFNGDNYFSYTDFFSINPANNAITRLGDLPIPNGGSYGGHAVAAFTINDKGYCLTYSLFPTEKNELYEFDPSNNQWTKKADFPGSTRKIGSTPFFFVLNGVGYIGGGWSAGYYETVKDLWSYDPALDVWTSLNFNLNLSGNYVAVNANGTAYLLNTQYTDWNNSYNTQFYEFIPSSKTFRISHFSTKTPLSLNGAFDLGGSSFLYSGSSIWEFDPSM